VIAVAIRGDRCSPSHTISTLCRFLNLLADWAPSAQDRRRILVESPDELFFAD
jgi:hypothetical protein